MAADEARLMFIFLFWLLSDQVCVILNYRNYIISRDAESVDFGGSGSKKSKIFGSGSGELIFVEFFFLQIVYFQLYRK